MFEAQSYCKARTHETWPEAKDPKHCNSIPCHGMMSRLTSTCFFRVVFLGLCRVKASGALHGFLWARYEVLICSCSYGMPTEPGGPSRIGPQEPRLGLYFSRTSQTHFPEGFGVDVIQCTVLVGCRFCTLDVYFELSVCLFFGLAASPDFMSRRQGPFSRAETGSTA